MSVRQAKYKNPVSGVITNPTGAPNPIRKGPPQELLETKGSIRTGPPREVDVCNKENWPG